MNWPNEELRNAKPSHQRLHFKVSPHLVEGLCHSLGKVASGVWQVESEVSPRKAPSSQTRSGDTGWEFQLPCPYRYPCS